VSLLKRNIQSGKVVHGQSPLPNKADPIGLQRRAARSLLHVEKLQNVKNVISRRNRVTPESQSGMRFPEGGMAL
jgi:hypothetical protein